jgi:hypothetical protein
MKQLVTSDQCLYFSTGFVSGNTQDLGTEYKE